MLEKQKNKKRINHFFHIYFENLENKCYTFNRYTTGKLHADWIKWYLLYGWRVAVMSKALKIIDQSSDNNFVDALSYYLVLKIRVLWRMCVGVCVCWSCAN